MSLSWSISCINYREPLLWVSIFLGCTIAWFLGSRLVRLSLRIGVHKFVGAMFSVVVTAPIAILAAFATLAFLYALVRGDTVCVHFVRPAFALPVIAAIASAFWYLVSGIGGLSARGSSGDTAPGT